MRKLIIVLMVSGLLSSCGFKLRGLADTGNESSRPLEITIQDEEIDKTFLKAIRRSLLNRVGESRAAAPVYLDLVRFSYDKRVLTVDSLGRVSEYELIQTLYYQLFLEGEDDANDYVIRTQRLMGFDREQLLIKEREEKFLKQEMTEDLIRQLKNHIRQLG